jgi:ribosome-binding factor A
MISIGEKMAGKRAVRVGDQVLREIAVLLLEKVEDPRVGGVTLTGIEMTNDLKEGRVFYSAIGGEEEIRKAKQGLDSARGFIKREIGRRLSLRYVPEIIFVHDPTLEKGSRMDRLFDKLRVDEPHDVSE